MIVYLASPYSHPDASVRNERFVSACRYAAKLMQSGHVVFCPIAHSHPIALQMDDGFATDHDFWMAQDLPLLSHCDYLYVLALPGWEHSRGIMDETEFARTHGIPIHLVNDEHSR